MEMLTRKNRPANVNYYFSLLLAMVAAAASGQNAFGQTIIENWTIQSGAKVESGGDVISSVNYDDATWYPVKGASTVLAALVKNNVYPDPYYGTNLATIPGYQSGYRLDMPAGSPFDVTWWYRAEFRVPEKKTGNHIYLHLHSINYQANVWINGKLVADSTEIQGAFRLFELDVTDYVTADGMNALALEIDPPTGLDPSIRWMQGTRLPPDNDAGIWYDVKITSGGPIHLKDPYVMTRLNLPATDKAELTISSSLTNKSGSDIKGILRGTIRHINNIEEGGTSQGSPGEIKFSQTVKLKKGETIRLSKQLVIKDPKLWWPVNVGKQNLYDLALEVTTGSGTVSERDTVRFGIREVSAKLEAYNDTVPLIGQSAGADKNRNGRYTQKKVMVHWINGKRILIRGGDWTENMMMETTPEEEEVAVRYAKNMNLNTLRLESFWGSDHFFDAADKYGIMVFNGLNCCSIWEEWDRWTTQTADVAVASLKDEVIRLRNHPSMVNWVIGSDNYPPREIEQRYIDVLKRYDPPTPFISVMPNRISTITGYTGYSERPTREAYPITWYEEMEGLNWESGGAGGEQIPPIESMRAMMPEYDLWPISGSWDIRLWRNFSDESRKYFYDRYGQPGSLEDYTISSQAWQYESNRAVYEATARSKYLTSGNLKYRYNAGWPALGFQFYDYYLRPNGSFYGAQKACEPLHVQYAYDDHAVYAVNSFYQPFEDLQVTARVYNADMAEKYQKTVSVDIGPDGSVKAFQIPSIEGLSNTFFLYLEMNDQTGKQVSRNFYWLSAKGDLEANFRALKNLPDVDLQATSTVQQEGKYTTANIVVTNHSNELAFFVHPTILKGLHGEEVLPVYWSENYFSLLPNQSYSVTATFDSDLLAGRKPYLMIDGWNIKSREYVLGESNSDVTPQLKYSDFTVPENIGLGRNFIVSVKITNEATTGSSIVEAREYLMIDGRSHGYKRIALAPGESTVLIWPYVKLHEAGKHEITIGKLPPKTIIGGEDNFFPVKK